MADQIFYTEGAKNTFFLTFSDAFSFKTLKQRALDLGLDPDGYILASKGSKNDVNFSFYNKDSSLVDFCGNALRATGLCFFDEFGEERVTLKTAVGEMKVEVLGENEVKAQMPAPKDQEDLKVSDLSAKCIVSGVPHLVFDLKEMKLTIEDLDQIRDFCQSVRSMSLGDKRETFNLTFYEVQSSHVNCVTFERGVEDFTKACGSGALSVFRALNEKDSNLKMPGGMLKVFKEKNEYFMEGPASIIKRI